VSENDVQAVVSEVEETVIETPEQELLAAIFKEPNPVEVEEPVAVASRNPSPAEVPGKRPRKNISKGYNPDRFLMQAKQTAVDNYNQHRNKRTLPMLTVDMVHIIWFSKMVDSWKAMVASAVAKGLIWEVTYDGETNQVYLNIYKQLNDVKIPQEIEK
jgi:hypothetical protein